MDNIYYQKYLKYKKKYLELKGGGEPSQCKGKPIKKPLLSKIDMNGMYKHYGSCSTSDGYAGFVENIVKIYGPLDKLKKNNVIMDMVKLGFQYHQIISSGVAEEAEIYEVVMETNERDGGNQYHILNINDGYFFTRAIGQGYVDLLAKDNKSPIGNKVAFMVSQAAKSFKYKTEKEPLDIDLYKKLAISMLIKMKDVADVRGRSADRIEKKINAGIDDPDQAVFIEVLTGYSDPTYHGKIGYITNLSLKGYDIKAMIDGKKIDFNLEDSLGGDPPFRLVHYISSLDKMGKFLPILIEYGIVKEALEGAGIPLYRRGTHENGEQNDLGSWAF